MRTIISDIVFVDNEIMEMKFYAIFLTNLTLSSPERKLELIARLGLLKNSRNCEE